jgi:multiple sugar transport system permease protein
MLFAAWLKHKEKSGGGKAAQMPNLMQGLTQGRQAQGRQAQVEPVQGAPTLGESMQVEPAQSKSAQSKSAQGKPAQNKPAQGRLRQGKPAQGKPTLALGKLRLGDGGFLFALPGLTGFAVFFIAPFLVSLGYAFLDRPVGGSFVGIDNFISLFANKAYRLGLINTLKFIVVSVPLNMGLSLGVAMLINRLGRRKELFSLIFLIPLVIPSGSMAFFWKVLFAWDGALNGWLVGHSIAKVNWLDSGLAFAVMVLVFVWKNLGYNMILFMAGLGNIPRDYYEAATVDGAGAWQLFRYITLPHLVPTGILTLIMSIINSFKVFKEIYLITGSYPHESIYTLQHFMNNMFSSLNYPRLTTATTVLVALIAVFTQTLLKVERGVSG